MSSKMKLEMAMSRVNQAKKMAKGGSSIKGVIESVRKSMGDYGAKRVQKAADEVKNLEKIYTEDALRRAFTGDNAQAMTIINPSDFEKYATPLSPRRDVPEFEKYKSGIGNPSADIGKYDLSTDDYIRHLASVRQRGGFEDVPYLNMFSDEIGLGLKPTITGHEGRHRSRSLAAEGQPSSLVLIQPRGDLREGMPRRYQDEFIDAMRRELSLSNRMVYPEKYFDNALDKDVQRPAVEIPEPFAEGGAVESDVYGIDPEVYRDRDDDLRKRFNVYSNSPSQDYMNLATTMNVPANSPVIAPRSQNIVQKGLGTLGGYMDSAGKFITEAMEPIAEKNPIKTGLVDFLVADSLRSAGTALQDYTGTSREITEDQPYAPSPIYGGKTLQTFKVDPRVLDVAGFASPLIRGTTKLAAKGVDEFGRPLAEKALTMLESGTDPLSRMNTRMTGMQGNPAFMGVDTPSTATMKVELDAKKLAPADELGFYSPAESVSLNIPRKSGNGQAFLNDLKKGGVKDDEIEFTGLGDFLRDKKNVTADEVRDYIGKNKIELKETGRGEIINDPVGMAKREDVFNKYEPEILAVHQEIYRVGPTNKLLDKLDSLKERRDIDADALYKIPEYFPPKFKSYSLPGGENYRELLLTMPQIGDKQKFTTSRFREPDGKWHVFDSNGAVVGRYATEDAAFNHVKVDSNRLPKENYRSPHFDEPNILAHMRVQDFTDAQGKKMMLVDELQSDWHQAGREQGYRKNDPITKNPDGTHTLTNPDGSTTHLPLTVNMNNIREGLNIGLGVPDAPFKENWHELALKRAIKEAVDKGYDRVGLTTGARQNERYDLSKQIDRIDYNKNDDGTYSMSAIKDGNEVFSKEDIAEKELSGIVGKDVAKKIVNDEGAPPKTKADRWEAEDEDEIEFKSLSGLDLSVGGQGMKKYYDEIYPAFLKKFAKKYNADFGQTTLPQAEGETVRYLEITPSMRDAVKKGLPYKNGGKVSFAKSIDAMRHELRTK